MTLTIPEAIGFSLLLLIVVSPMIFLAYSFDQIEKKNQKYIDDYRKYAKKRISETDAPDEVIDKYELYL